jgi:hypothetical protein
MRQDEEKSQFKAQLHRPKEQGKGKSWGFIVLPTDVSAKLPRRGRTTVDGSINGQAFRALLEPDGKKSHWLRIDKELFEAAGVALGDIAQFEIVPVQLEPEPEVPADLRAALETSSESLATWNDTTTIARLDWIHWVTSAKQERTRKKRIDDACDMLASGEKRVCCFDSSGYYSKAFSAPQIAD